MTTPSIHNIASLLEADSKVRVGVVDGDGILRGKIMSKEKFLQVIEHGFGFSSAIFGWDMHDETFRTSTAVANKEQGFHDFVAIPDIKSFRRIPWEGNIPFFLLDLFSDNVPVSVDPRHVLRTVTRALAGMSIRAQSGVELEFLNFETPGEDGYEDPNARPNLAGFLMQKAPASVRSISYGMFAYSNTRPLLAKDYFHDLFDTSSKFQCNIEGWHTESGPGVYEAALAVCEVSEMADRVSLFKYLARSVGIPHRITPCFMAKPLHGKAGSSGHIHISLTDMNTDKNLFARDEPNHSPRWHDVECLSDVGISFLAGVLEALPDIMPLLAPNVNSYKRFIESYWAPVDISWGLESRLSSIRLIAPPVCKPSATRFEIRIPGADLQPHYALAAILAAGVRGIRKKLDLSIPPASMDVTEPTDRKLLPNTLEKAVANFSAPSSVARDIFPDEFIDWYTASRQHELSLWKEAVTDWEFVRYIETA